MTLTKSAHRLTVEEYLEGEKLSSVRHEYLDGEVYERVGTSKRQNLIASRFHERVRAHLRGGMCQSYIVDVKIYIAPLNTFLLP